MFFQLMTFKTLSKLLRDDLGTPDLFSVKSLGPQRIILKRDDTYGLESVIQNLSCGHGMTYAGLNRLNNKLGWLVVTKRN